MRTITLLAAAVLALAACTPSEEPESTSGERTSADEPSAQAASDSPVIPADAESVTAEPEPEPEPEVSYRRDVAPIFAEKCISCHHDNNAVQVILTDPFDPGLGIVNRPNTWTQSSRPVLVVPGDPDASALMLKVEETELELKVEGDPMPWNIPRVTDAQLAALASWINAGALENATYQRDVVPIFGDGVSLGRRGGKCTYCHHPWEGRFEPDLVNTFDPDSGAVNVASFYGGLRIAPGDAQASVVYLRSSPAEIPANLEPLMPKHYERLTNEELAILREWIATGARNN
jgi:mono/diheme cytochrome c family protein